MTWSINFYLLLYYVSLKKKNPVQKLVRIHIQHLQQEMSSD